MKLHLPRTGARNRRCRTAATVAAFLLSITGWASAEPVTTANVTAELLSEHETIQPGRPFTVAIALRPAPGWHTYWMNPGETGLPTRVEWKLPAGFIAGAIEWPYPDRLGAPPYVSYGFDGEVLLPVRVAAPAALAAGSSARLMAKTKWLACREDACVPGKADLELELQVEAAAPHRDSRWTEAFDRTRARLPRALEGWSATAEDLGDTVRITVTSPEGKRPSTTGIRVFPSVAGVLDPSSEVSVRAVDDGFVLEGGRSPRRRALPDPLGLVLVADEGWDEQGSVRALRLDAAATVGSGGSGAAGGGAAAAAPAADARKPVAGALQPAAADAQQPVEPPARPATPVGEASPTLWAALVLALAGGLVLNLMPCVFPVLSLKVLGFVHVAHHDASVVRRHGLAFTGGVLVSFWLLAGLLLALRAAGSLLGWGFQLQQPLFVAAMASLLVAMATNLLGAWEVGSSLSGAAGRFDSASGYRGSFLSGALATLVATPCTAPFMGTAVGFALAQSPVVALAVFTALGAGMAMPYLVLAFVPALLRRLPRPGPWMEVLREAMAFPLLATALWLAWVFGRQAGEAAMVKLLAALVVLASGTWLAGRAAAASSGFAQRALRALGLSLVAASLVVAAVASREEAAVATTAEVAGTGEVRWLPWSQEAVAAQRREGRAVLVDFTADWCLTCKANEAVALSGEAFVSLLRERDVVAMKADWTSADPRITEALASFGRSGVPLVVVYPRDPSREPVVLPQVLTPAIVRGALEAAAT